MRTSLGTLTDASFFNTPHKSATTSAYPKRKIETRHKDIETILSWSLFRECEYTIEQSNCWRNGTYLAATVRTESNRRFIRILILFIRHFSYKAKLCKRSTKLSYSSRASKARPTKSGKSKGPTENWTTFDHRHSRDKWEYQPMRNCEADLSSEMNILFWLLGFRSVSLTAESESRWSG